MEHTLIIVLFQKGGEQLFCSQVLPGLKSLLCLGLPGYSHFMGTYV